MNTPVSENTPALGQSEQGAMPVALVQGTPLTQAPRDLYIPPDALNVFLEEFEGPLDLLLYLVKRANIDILNIPVAHITAQYMRYIELMEELQIELAGEYLVMAAMLTEIKSRMLLPNLEESGDEEDPRAELVRRIQEYERYKQVTEDLDALPRCERDIFAAVIEFPNKKPPQKMPDVSLDALLCAYAGVLNRAEMYAHHHIQREPLSVRERMIHILEKIDSASFVDFKYCFEAKEGRAGVIVAFLAILELLRDRLIEMAQNESNGPIYIKAAG